MPELRRLAVLLCALAPACAGTRGPSAPAPETQAQADPRRAAQEAARQAAVADLYERWRYDFVLFQSALEDLRRRRAAAPVAGGEPVRTLDELLRETTPEEHDPETRELFERWRQKSSEYDARLRQLSSDPESDPRSPLLPEVREALAPPPG